MDAAELVARAERALGVEGDAALATALGLSGYSAPQRIRRWRSGENEPDFQATLSLLDAAGLLRRQPRRARRQADADDAESAALLAELEAEVAGVFARLRQRLDDQGQRESPG